MHRNPTLVNVAEAADLEVTALPSMADNSAVSSNHGAFTKTTQQDKKKKVGLWKRIWTKIKGKSKKREREEGIWHGNEGSGGAKVKKIEIGEPTHFRHERTGGALGLRVEEDEWEDIEETRGDLRSGVV